MLYPMTFGTFAADSAITESVIFLSYILICAALFKRRFSRLATALAFVAAGVVIAGLNTVGILSGEYSLVLTLLPLTAYLPFSVLLYFMSEGGMFETAAVCSVGALGVLILRSLYKILTAIILPAKEETSGYILYITVNIVIALAAAGLVTAAFLFIGKAFRFCIIGNKQNRLTLSLPVILIFLMMFWSLNSTANIITLLLTMLTAVSIFFIIAKLLNSTAELIHVRRSEKELSEYIDVQRRGYDRVMQKMESVREYRHDMRHHLTVIEGLIRQGDHSKAFEYVSGLNGSFGELESMRCCTNPEINAVLSEYIGRAEMAGCKVTQRFALPELIPFEEQDVCLVLANAVENAIKACSKFPEEDRYINISAEYSDGHRLIITVINPCGSAVEFDENSLPVSQDSSEEHGIGLRSVKRIVEKYNGFLRCMLENDEFVLQAALFYDNSDSKHKDKKTGLTKRAVSSLLGLGLVGIVMLNVLPSAADAASELLSVNIRTIRDLKIGWGDNRIDIEAPEFSGNGADELNSAVKNYTDEAKEKFLWYFSRSYNGYVAEDMRYTVIRDDENYFIAQFNVTANAGGSLDYSRWITFDKKSGKVLELPDLFREDIDYIEILSDEILEQMIYKNEHEEGSFFVDGEDAFTGINEDANFYIDSFDRLVIVFDEYEVAPGYMGSPEFYIPKKLLEEMAR